MKPRTALFQLLLLTMTASVSGQTLTAPPEGQWQRTLNLTLPKQATQDTSPDASKGDWDAVSARQLPQSMAGSKREEGQGAGRLPYGAGYESRQQGMASGGSGRGAGGQGGMGRRR